jgi:hypothetical protein
MKRLELRIALPVLICLASAGPSFGQFMDNQFGFNFNNPMSSLCATMIMNKAREDDLAKRLGVNRTGHQGTVSAPARRALNDAAVRFRPSGTFLKTRELADQLGITPEEREQYLKLMNAVIMAFEKEAVAAGKPNDLALALSYFFAENARIYHGRPEPSHAQLLDLRNRAAEVLAESRDLSNASDRQKQEMYETLVAYTGLTQFGYEQAMQGGNQPIVNGYKQVAGQNLQRVTHLSPDNIDFTAEGLTIR